MKKLFAILFAVVTTMNTAFSQGTSINTTGTTADPSAMLDVNSTKQGMLVPRMTQAQKLAISNPANGLLIYQTDGVTGFYYYNNTTWVQAIGATGTNGTNGATGATGTTGPSNIWGLTGNAGTVWNTNFIGTTDNSSLRFRTNNTPQVIIDSLGKVGIGTTMPSTSAKLDVSSNSQGFVLPRMTEVQRNAIVSPAIGLQIFNLTSNCWNIWNGITWKQLCGDCPFTSPIAGNNGPICSGLTLNLTATPIAGATYQWTGPNGFTSTLQNPTFPNAAAAISGTYTLTTAMNGCTSTPQITFVTVNTSPSPTAGNNGPVCTGAALNLTASTISGATYNWTGPNGYTANVQNPSISYVQITNAGTYTVSVVGGNGCVATAGTNVTVNATPTVTATPPSQTLSTGSFTNIALTSNVTGTTFGWTVQSTNVSGASSGSGSSIAQVLSTSGISSGSATYIITSTANGCAGTPTNVVVTVNSIAMGTGADGAITISANHNINTDNIATGRSCPDAVNYSVTALTTNTATLSSTPGAGCLVVGDEVLLINLQGTSANNVNVGNYETFRIQQILSNIVTFTSNKINFYGDGAANDNNIGTTTSNQRVMLQRVPNYTNVTVNGSVTLTSNAWNGTLGGVLFFRANGTVLNSGTITMSGNGYKGGTAAANGSTGGTNGESYDGFVGIGGSSNGGGTAGGGSANGYINVSPSGSRGGGGGGGSDNSGQSDDGAGGGGGGSYGGGGGGGGAGSDCSMTGGTGGTGGTLGGGGGGAENACVSGNNNGGSSGTAGQTGNGHPAASAGSGTTTGQGASGGSCTCNGAGAGGGGGLYGTANLTTLFFGSGGGSGGGSNNGGSPQPASSGGGIIYISTGVLTNSGSILSVGNNATSPSSNNGGGGGGAGGSIKLIAITATLGSNLVIATTSSNGSPTSTAGGGGGGGVGIIAVSYNTSISGTTNPAANVQQVP